MNTNNPKELAAANAEEKNTVAESAASPGSEEDGEHSASPSPAAPSSPSAAVRPPRGSVVRCPTRINHLSWRPLTQYKPSSKTLSGWRIGTAPAAVL